MAKTFQAKAVWDAIWPEVLGVGMVVTAMIVAAQVDAARVKTNPTTAPWAQRAVTVGSLLASGYGIGSDRMTELSKGAFYTTIGVVAANCGQWIFANVNKQPLGMKAGDILSLVPQQRLQALAAGNTGAMSVQQKLALQNWVAAQAAAANGSPQLAALAVAGRGM